MTTQLDRITSDLARDLARGLLTPEEIAERHGLDYQTMSRLATDKSFLARLEEEKRLWGSPSNARERAVTKAQLAVEELIVTMSELVADSKETGTARVSAFSQLKEIARLGRADPDAGNGAGPLWSITINLGGGDSVSVDGDYIDVTEEADADEFAVDTSYAHLSGDDE